MEAENIEDIGPPMLKIFRGFAESTRSDLKALVACVRGFRKTMDPATLARVAQPVLICVGTRDDVAGDPRPLQPLFRQAEVVDIPGRDHNRAVGDRVYKQAVLSFLAGESVVPRADG
jgi:pimeloyl-ACP methyl ester carboxylesterase